MLRSKSIPLHYRMPVILAAALLTTALLMLVVRLPGLLGDGPEERTVYEQGGVYDLSGLGDWGGGRSVNLPPGASYYPNTYLLPADAGAAEPESTDRYEKIRAGYLSQRFVLKLPEDGEVYALTFKLSGRHALRVYVNGREAGQTGRPGTGGQDTEVWENTITCYGTPSGGQMDIILHSAQFHHFKRGASLAALSVQKAAPPLQAGFSAETKGFLVMGALLCAALFLFCLFLLRPGTKATLYFALACLAMVLREGLQSQAWAYLSWIPGNLSFMLEYFSVVLLTVFLTLYLAQDLKGRFWRLLKGVMLAGSGLYGACLLLADPLFYTSVLKYYQALLVAGIAVGVGGFFGLRRRPTGEQSAALYGIAVFYLAAVSDILMYSNIFGEVQPNLPVSEAAMLIFVLAQTVSLFLMNNRLLAEAKAAEQKLAAEKGALENLNRMKTEFLSNISHELKTPLTVVSSNIQYARGNLPAYPELAATDQAMRLIDGETARMGMLVSQLLDAGRIDEGRMSLEKKRESIVAIIQSTLDDYYPVFTKNHNTLKVQKEGRVPPVLCDRARIAQVLVNLITNAARHTREGRITVSVRGEGAWAAVTVADTGEGIAPERLPHLFERYYSRGAAAEKTRAGWDTGTGLGLYICRHIVEAHGGTITLASEPDRGTRVTFTLPIAAEI